MEFFTSMMERVVAFWRNRRFFQFRKFHKFRCPLWKRFSEALNLFKFIRLYIYITSLHKVSKKRFIGLRACSSQKRQVKKKLLNSTLRAKTFFRCLHLQPTISNKEGQKSGACLTSFTNFPFSSSRASTTTSNREKKEKKSCLSKEKNCVEKKVFRQQWNFLKHRM